LSTYYSIFGWVK